MSQPRPQHDTPSVFESVSRRTYWLWIAGLMVVLIVASIVGGFYNLEISELDVDPAGGPATPGIEHRDPITAFLYSRVGLVVILAVFQFIAANLLFWPGAWLVQRFQRRG